MKKKLKGNVHKIQLLIFLSVKPEVMDVWVKASTPGTDLSDYIWTESIAVDNSKISLFPEDSFGRYILSRDRLVKKVFEAITMIQIDSPDNAASVYVNGCHGSGKTCLLLILAEKFKNDGYTVYYFPTARRMPMNAAIMFERLLKDKSKKVAVIIDEVIPYLDALYTLLKGAYPKLVTIGAAVPRWMESGTTCMFKVELCISELVLQKEDNDFQDLIKFCVNLKATAPDPTQDNCIEDVTQDICIELLNHCGGHPFPTLAFIAYFFTREDTKKYIKNLSVFNTYFNSKDFEASAVYKLVARRCFDDVQHNDYLIRVHRLLLHKADIGDEMQLEQIGWWNTQTSDFISTFFLNICKPYFEVPECDNPLYLSESISAQENTELVIIAGLAGMDDSDILCDSSKFGIVVNNALSFCWAFRMQQIVPNVFMKYQHHSVSGGYVDFYINSHADTTIKVIRNARNGSEGQAIDIDTHLNRFTSGKYHWNKFVLLNFAMTTDLVLPRDEASHEKVYTYVRSTNILYRGNKVLKTNAMPKLSGGSKPMGLINNNASSSNEIRRQFVPEANSPNINLIARPTLVNKRKLTQLSIDSEED